ncbi:mannose-6-phosphate isomerase, class I [Streptomyces sp. NBC_01216]|uniref:mannose-6-phosphate isomerase, class I n=1 Tax=unclassified Streptomyces TaxID=2593676 RepID=UPI002E0EFF8B|nr:mannose-6-phosphate isomerase, class I [Streptomyces sp. NBC_01216]
MDLLSATVQPYAWGSPTALPRLMGLPVTGEPQAELWLGAHPAAPSLIEREGAVLPLDRVIAADPGRELGAPALRRFGPRLPFLLKLLAADAPLSLQVHPDAAQAEAGYAAENARGVPLDAPHRNYRDRRHKPEMIVALTPFEGLCGFRAPGESAALLDDLGVPGLRPFAEVLRTGPEEAALQSVFTGLLAPAPGLLDATAGAVAHAAGREGPHRADWAAYRAIARAHPGDTGLLPALMLRYVRLEPGEALFLGAGVPHAYLSGLGVEVMAGSDNVLRCGLTAKHVDAEELLKVVRFTAPPHRTLTPRVEAAGAHHYPAPVDDFRLTRITARSGDPARPLRAGAPRIVLCTEGEALLTSADEAVRIGPGRAVYVPAWEPVTLTGHATVFSAGVADPADASAGH